jgi:5-methylcytosine-specific restriction endonuclease McrA
MTLHRKPRPRKPRLPGDPPEAPSSMPRPRKRIAPQSAKRAAENAPDGPRAAVRAFTLNRAKYRCEAEKLDTGIRCGFFGKRSQLEVHERIPRSLYPGGHLDVENTIALCPRHHDWVDEHQDEAHAVGLHGKSWERP